MLISFWIEDYLKHIGTTWATQIPSILYTGLVYIMNVYYRKLATYLTEWGRQEIIKEMKGKINFH